ncbi:hypothetical protein N5J07_02580 [Comamonas aquatica]|uniref:hypothetical protein n=1 Tax=Comamonas aquatica TaxID=225991 RepID=UPI00244AA183|nr:hypothetical protein [Comamonas aquatica]MDH1378359.1 hypothetical protein [Comamonas aquatica]MDH1638369.1 hypothetical protein [Comamonas aquatica]
MTPLVREMVALAPDMAEQMHWFDCGTAPEGILVNLDSVNDNPLPYGQCAVCGMDDAGGKWLILLRQVDQVVAVAAWSMRAKSYDKHPGFTYARTDEGLRIASIDTNPAGTEAARGVLAAIGRWLMSLTPQTQAYRATARPSFINSKRKAKGKPPALFDWRTVVIAPPPEPGPPKGGTHASPRLHDRRGHWRNHPSGKQVWVKACKVGDAAKGVIFKDYEVKP